MLAPIKTLAAGAGLILLANAVALTGVYFNRSGEPESRMTLSQRELSMPWGWGMDKENSGLALGLNWRIKDGSSVAYSFGGDGFHGGTPEWLDEPRMKALGFDTAHVPEDPAGRRRFERQLHHLVGALAALPGDESHAARVAWGVRGSGSIVLQGTTEFVRARHNCLWGVDWINMHSPRISFQSTLGAGVSQSVSAERAAARSTAAR